MREYIGALHMHTVYSDGSGTIEEVAGFANEVGLDFIIITDHNTLRALEDGKEGWYNNTYAMIGCEINDKQNLNHYLALGINKAPSTRLPAAEYVKLVNDLGGIGFLAHPHEKRSSMKEHPPYPWTEWNVKDFTGIEIWNHMSEWMEGLTEQNKYNYFVHPLRSIKGPPGETLKVWDELNKKRKVVGIGGVDAHAHKVNLLGFFEVEVFPYKVLFKSVRTHILTDKELKPGKSEESKTILLEAMGTGRCFISNCYHGDAKGFRFFGKSANKIYHMGDTVPSNEKVRLHVILPNIVKEIRLIYNGELVDSLESGETEFVVKRKGIYRVEIYSNGNPWIYTNHIRIGI